MIEALFLALALAMDAFAVALTQGARFRPGWAGTAAIALTFGAFQMVMPLIGWGIGAVAFTYIEFIDHWIAFGLLSFLGLRMLGLRVLGGHSGDNEAASTLTGGALIIAGIATSIDALAAGITLPTIEASLWLAVALIGGVTFAMSAGGVVMGRIAGDRWGPWAERVGGVILIALGCKILAEHTGWL